MVRMPLFTVIGEFHGSDLPRSQSAPGSASKFSTTLVTEPAAGAGRGVRLGRGVGMYGVPYVGVTLGGAGVVDGVTTANAVGVSRGSVGSVVVVAVVRGAVSLGVDWSALAEAASRVRSGSPHPTVTAPVMIAIVTKAVTANPKRVALMARVYIGVWRSIATGREASVAGYTRRSSCLTREAVRRT